MRYLRTIKSIEMKTFEDIEIYNSIYWTTGEITCEYLLYKIYNNWMCVEITTSEAVDCFEKLMNQIRVPDTLLELTLTYLWNDYRQGRLTMTQLITQIEKIIDLLEKQKK